MEIGEFVLSEASSHRRNKLALTCAISLMLWGVLFMASVACAEDERLLFMLSDQRNQSVHVSVDEIRAALSESLEIPVEVASDRNQNANFGVLTVIVTRQLSVLSWVLPDGRTEVRELSHGPKNDEIVGLIVTTVLEMDDDLRRRLAVLEGELIDPYETFRHVRLPSPWSDSWEVTPQHKQRSLFFDLLDPFSTRPLRRVHNDDTIDPWG